MMKFASLTAFALLALTLPASAAEDWQKPDSPYRMGEAYPEVAATCETIKYWINHAPQTDDRVSIGIIGHLVSVDWDAALAYLIMCDEPGVQVMCVTYSKDGMNIGDKVLFGGGYSRVDDNKIMLDPCLASHEG